VITAPCTAHTLSAPKRKDKMCMLVTGESLAMSESLAMGESVGMRGIRPLSESGDGIQYRRPGGPLYTSRPY
jgi:hypothetical protein